MLLVMTNTLQLIQKLSLIAFLLGSMFGAGLGLTPSALTAPLRRVSVVLLALGLNFVFAPALAWLLTMTIPLEQGHAIALLLLGGAAGAPFLPKLAESARGDLALAVALMALLTAGTLVFMPFVLPLIIPGLEANPWKIAQPLLLFIVAPLAIGMLLNAVAPTTADRIRRSVLVISNLSLVALFVLLVTLNLRALLGVIGSGAILAAILYVIGLLAGSWITSGSKIETKKLMTLGTAGRNFGAAFVPATTSFTDPTIEVALIVNAIVGMVLLFAAAAWLKRKS
jgi:BASS family bile acid:Na+ symporter